jgi:hypothetical protein
MQFCAPLPSPEFRLSSSFRVLCLDPAGLQKGGCSADSSASPDRQTDQEIPKRDLRLRSPVELIHPYLGSLALQDVKYNYICRQLHTLHALARTFPRHAGVCCHGHHRPRHPRHRPRRPWPPVVEHHRKHAPCGTLGTPPRASRHRRQDEPAAMRPDGEPGGWRVARLGLLCLYLGLGCRNGYIRPCRCQHLSSRPCIVSGTAARFNS